MNCANCGEETHRIYGFYCDSYGGWLCFECYDELKEELEE
jgi:hypothetical protein